MVWISRAIPVIPCFDLCVCFWYWASYCSVNKTKLAVTLDWGNRLISSAVVHGPLGLFWNRLHSRHLCTDGFVKDICHPAWRRSFQMKCGRRVHCVLFYFSSFLVSSKSIMSRLWNGWGTLLFMKKDDVILSHGVQVVIGRPPQIITFNSLPQTAGIRAAGSQWGNKQLAFFSTKPQEEAVE